MQKSHGHGWSDDEPEAPRILSAPSLEFESRPKSSELGGLKSCTSMILMSAQNWRVSCQSWMISLCCRNGGGIPTTGSPSGCGMTHATYAGMRSGCIAHAAARKTDMSAPLAVLGDVLKMRHDEPMMVCTTSHDQT
jgi:hypothetical protein